MKVSVAFAREGSFEDMGETVELMLNLHAPLVQLIPPLEVALCSFACVARVSSTTNVPSVLGKDAITRIQG